MDIQFLSGPAAQRRLLQLIDACERFECAVAWATRNSVSEAMERNSAKAQKVVIGTHRFGTCPELLARFAQIEAARVMSPEGDLFHPKVYTFHLPNGTAAAVVGSHNLTASAFGRNMEASILITGRPEENSFGELFAFIEKAWARAEWLSTDFLADYAREHSKKRAAKDELVRFQRTRLPRGRATDTLIGINARP